MNFFKRIYCRAYQAAFRLAIPFLPYRAPKILRTPEEAADVFRANKIARVLLVCGENGFRSGRTKSIEEALRSQGVTPVVFSAVKPDPAVQTAERAFELYRKEGCNGIVAVGGGSPIDCAKAVCARVARPKKSLQQMRGVLKVRGKTPLFVAVPTTAGSGSEATIAAVLTDENTHDKFTLLSFCLAPQYALLAPEMTKTLSPAATAETGMDALTHAVEAYIGRSTTKRTRALAVNAVKLVFENLLTAFEHGDDLEARKKMQLAAFDAGKAFTVSYVGYVHALAHALGGEYGYPHGRTNATLLPYVLKAYGKSAQKKLARLARASGISVQKKDAAAANEFITAVQTLNKKTGIPARLELDERDALRLARHADGEANPLYPVPKLMNANELCKIYLAARKQPKTE